MLSDIYLIISKKNPLYGFSVKTPVNSDISIKNLEIFQDKSLRNMFHQNSNSDKGRFFKDRWLISVILDKKVTSAKLIYTYYNQRALKIDEETKKNLIKLYVVNPYPYDLGDLNIEVVLLNFQNLTEKDLTVPAFSELSPITMNEELFKGKGFAISIKKNLPIHSEFFIQLALPMAITSCGTQFDNIVYYSLIGMTIGFILVSFTAVFVLYKE